MSAGIHVVLGLLECFLATTKQSEPLKYLLWGMTMERDRSSSTMARWAKKYRILLQENPISIEAVMKRKKVIVCIVFVLVLAIFMTLMIISIFHSLPSADDFSMAVGIKNRSDLLGMSIKRANGFYMSWSGSWSAIFLETVLNPLVWFKGKGAIAALRIGLILNCAVFITVLVLLWNSICKNLLNIESAVIRNVLSIIVVWGILLGNVYSEIFYWYVGSVYSWYMTFAMLSIIGMIEYFLGEQNKDTHLVLLTIWGSLACSLLNFIIPVILIYIFILCSSRKRNRNYL